MTDTPYQPPMADALPVPAQELASWARGLRLVLTFVSAFFAYWALRMMMSAYKFERIFEEMLGDKNKLPHLTRFIIDNAMSLTAGVFFLNILGIVLIWSFKRGFSVCFVACSLLLVDFLVIQFGVAGLFSPLIQIIQSLSSGA